MGRLIVNLQLEGLQQELAIAKGAATEALQNLDASEAEVTKLKEQLERYWRRSDRNRRIAFLWKEHAKKLATGLRELGQEAKVAAELLERRGNAYELLWENYKREQRTHAVYRAATEHFTQALRRQIEDARPVLKACEAVPESTLRQTSRLSIPWLAKLFEAIDTWIKAEANSRW